VYIDYYISPKLKTATPDAQQMIDILQEYQSRSNGGVTFSVKDPSKPEHAGAVEKFGLQAQQIQVLEKSETTFATVYSGIVLSYQSETRTIPFFLQPAVLEYQITSKIQEMITNDTRVVGVLVLDDFYKNEQTLGGLTQTLKADYEVRTIEKGTAIDEDVDSLFIIGAKDVDNDTAYYIDQFLMQGKGVYFAADKVRVDVNMGLFGTSQNTLIHDMLASYGITIEDTLVLDSYNKLIPVNGGNGIQMLQNYPMWVTVLPKNVDKENPITARFGGLDLFWTSPLTVAEDKKDYVTTLISSSEESWTKGYEKTPGAEEEPKVKLFKLQPDQMQFVIDKTEENTKSYAMTSAFFGPVTSAVEEGIITKPDGVVDYVSEGESSRFIVTGSSLFASYLYRYTNADYNMTFLSNASDWLGSDEKLLQIKSRIVKDMRLNKIQDPAKASALAFVVQLWNIVLLPIIVIAIAVVILLFRRRISSKKFI